MRIVATNLPPNLGTRCSRSGLFVVLLAALVAGPMRASAEVGARSAIGLDEIVSALHAAGLPTETAKVTLLTSMTAASAEPVLEMLGVGPAGVRGARVRMGCVEHSQCLPFFVAVEWADAAGAAAALRTAGLPAPVDPNARKAAALSSPRNLTGPVPATGRDPIVSAAPAPAFARTTEAASDGSVHAGTHATLIIDGQKLHITIPIICLGNGGPGRSIRVTALDHRQTWVAEVVDSTLLKGTL